MVELPNQSQHNVVADLMGYPVCVVVLFRSGHGRVAVYGGRSVDRQFDVGKDATAIITCSEKASEKERTAKPDFAREGLTGWGWWSGSWVGLT